MDDMAKSRNELVEEIGRMHRSRHRVRMAGLELLQEQMRTHTLLRESPDAILLCDDAGTIQLMSLGAEALFGFEELDLLNRPLSAIIPCPDEYNGDAPRYLAHLHDTHRNSLRHPLEVYNRMGQRMLLSFSLSLVSVDDLLDDSELPHTGDYQAALCIFHDHSAQKQALDEMMAHHRNLERLVQEMREELHAAELENRVADQQAVASRDLMMNEFWKGLEHILDLAETAAALEETAQCPNLMQTINGIRYIAEGLTRGAGPGK